MTGPTAPPAEADGRAPERVAPLGPSDLLLLLSALCLALFATLSPLLGFTLFGSDSGEYYRLTQILLAQGHLPVGNSFALGGYRGWGYAYPDFPGIYLLVGAAAQSMGFGVFGALTIFLPAITALSVLPLFLLFRRVVPQDTVAILAAAIATVAMPRLFSIAHPAPLALGDLLAVAALWLFVEGRRDRRYYAPLVLVAATLVVTHHLSSYFFLLSAAGSLLLVELWRPTAWSRRFPARELAFLAAFAVGMLVFWIQFAPDFHGVIASGSLPGALVATPLPLAAAGVAAFLLAGLLIRFRWSRAPRHPTFRVRLSTGGRVLRDGLLIGIALVAGLSVLVVVPLPGTTQTIQPTTLAWYSPFLLLVIFAAGSRRTLSLSRLSPFGITWVAAIGLSAIFALVSRSPVLPVSRHAEYLVIPLALLIASVLGYLAIRIEAAGGRRALLAFAAGVTVLLAANVVIAYPPPSDLGGFQEGLTAQDATLWMWGGSALPNTTVAATDHPLSSMLFGFDGWYANWQFNSSTENLFVGSNWSWAAAELESMAVPHCPYRGAAQVVVIDGTMSTGVALDPAAPAYPLSPSAIAWFRGAPFVPIYENGPQVVYWVDGPVGSSLAASSC